LLQFAICNLQFVICNSLHSPPVVRGASFSSFQFLLFPQRSTLSRGVSVKETTASEERSAPGTWGLPLSAWCIVAAFGTYFCMYAFRKPFTAAGYQDTVLWGLSFKTVLVTAQVLGYTLSKFLGIKVVAEVRAERRVALLIGLVVAAEAALFLF